MGKEKDKEKKAKETPVFHFKKYMAYALLFLFFVIACIGNYLVHQSESKKNAWFKKCQAPFGGMFEYIGNVFAEFTDNWGITGRDVSVPVEKEVFDLDSSPIGYPVFAKSKKKKPLIRILDKIGFVVGYTPELRHPLWVAYKVSPQVISGPVPERPDRAAKDPHAPYSPEDKAYSRSEYDRGLLASDLAIARRYGRKGLEDAFLTSNICPQLPGLNRGPWRDLAYRISELWPSRYGTIWVIVGAFSGGRRKNLSGTGVDIPVGFYQIAVSQSKGKLRAVAVYMNQDLSRRAFPRASLVSIDHLEALTGLDFFSELPDEIEDKLEAGTPTRLWPAGFGGSFRIFYQRNRFFVK